MRDWPPVFTLLLPFFGWLTGELVLWPEEPKAAPLQGLLIGLCAGLAADMAIAIADWWRK